MHWIVFDLFFCCVTLKTIYWSLRLVPETKPTQFVGLVAGTSATRISMQNTSTHYGTGPRSKSLRQVPATSPLVCADLKISKPPSPWFPLFYLDKLLMSSISYHQHGCIDTYREWCVRGWSAVFVQRGRNLLPRIFNTSWSSQRDVLWPAKWRVKTLASQLRFFTFRTNNFLYQA